MFNYNSYTCAYRLNDNEQVQTQPALFSYLFFTDAIFSSILPALPLPTEVYHVDGKFVLKRLYNSLLFLQLLY